MVPLIVICFCGCWLFFVCFAINQRPNHKPEQGAANINEPGPPRCLEDKEDNKGDNVIEENVKSHSAFVLKTDAKIPLPQMRLGNVVKI